jgi:hypothetical protein
LLRVCGEHGGNSIQGDKKHQLPITRHVISGQYRIYIYYTYSYSNLHTPVTILATLKKITTNVNNGRNDFDVGKSISRAIGRGVL